MTDLLAILGALLALEIVFAGMLLAWRSLSPASVERARLRVDRTPWRCFWLGCLAALILVPPIATMFALPLVASRIAGCVLLLTLIAFSGLGAAGLASRIGKRLAPHSGDALPAGSFVRRSLVVELAAGVWMGGVAAVILLPPAIVLMRLPLQLTWPTAWSLLFVVGVVLGAASLFTRRGAGARQVVTEADLRGGTALLLASGFPVIGWFVALPIAFLTSLGASVFALLRWMPKTALPEARAATGTRGMIVSALALLWLLPFLVISVSTAVFLVRGGVALELASDLPFVGWLTIVLLWIVAVVGGTAFAFSRWGPWWRQPMRSGGIE